MMPRIDRISLTKTAVSAAIVFILAKLSVQIGPNIVAHFIPIWPISGVTLTLVLTLGPPAIVGVALVTLLFFWLNLSGPHLPHFHLLLAGLLFCFGTVFQYASAFWALGRKTVRLSLFERPSDVLRFSAIVVVCSLIGTVIQLPALSLIYPGLPMNLFEDAWTMTLSRAVGMVILPPFYFSWFGDRRRIAMSKGRLAEGVFLYLTLFVLSVDIFTKHLPGNFNHQFFLIPLLLWATVRFGERGLTSAVIISFTIAACAFYHGISSFTEDMGMTARSGLLLMQAYTFFTEIPFLVLAASLRESRIKDRELRKAHAQLLEVNINLEKRVEERTRDLEKLTKELRRANEELEEFAYVASHDLQQPLRMVSSFLELIRKSCEGKIGKETDEYIRFARESALRMQQLIRALLDMARLGSRAPNFCQCDLKEVIYRVVAGLKISIDNKKARIHLGELPLVVADPTMMFVLFQNLIGNALKFGRQSAPEIDIKAQVQGADFLFSVRDNGIGIPPEQVRRLFKMFHRLHNTTEYPGTGIGLAQCKKTVERHNGRIWVESTLGGGSTFFFTISRRIGVTIQDPSNKTKEDFVDHVLGDVAKQPEEPHGAGASLALSGQSGNSA